MNEEKQPSTQTAEGPSTPNRPRRPALVYLVILFAAAFVLLLFAYLMQQRNSREIIGNLNDLRSSITSIGSLDELLEENRALREEIEGLQAQITDLESTLSDLEGELSATQDEVELWKGRNDDAWNIIGAFHRVAQLRDLYEQDRTEEAKAFLKTLEELGETDSVEHWLTIYLSRDPNYPAVLETFTPLVEWREMTAALAEAQE